MRVDFPTWRDPTTATTGKKGGFVKALGKGVYRLEESLGTETPQASQEAPKPKLRGKAPKKTRKTKARKQVKRKVGSV